MTKILVIEDDQTVRTLLLKLLQAEGFDVLTAIDGLQGVELAQQHEPDLIICDVMMPECDGYQVLNQLRNDNLTAGIPFIFLSAKASRTDLRQGMDLGADDYVTKPFTRNELLGAITARLNKRATITQPYITEMKRAAENLNRLAYRDPLTNLPNRIALYERLQQEIASAQSNTPFAVLCLKLETLETINDSLGHITGDLLIKEVADRLRHSVDADATVARASHDQFSVVLPTLNHVQSLTHWVESLLNLLVQPYSLDAYHTQITIKAGIALYPNHGTGANQLLNYAEIALNWAEAQPGTSYRIYSPDIQTQAIEQQAMVASLQQALEQSQFQLYYQPQVNLITKRIVGAEALLRWQHPMMGLLYPEKFMAVAKDSGLISKIDHWVLETACNQAQTWQSSYLLPLKVSVNLSAHKFKNPSLIPTISKILKQTKLDPRLLVLELTETDVMTDVDTAATTLAALKEIGVQISLDDFGTGFSCLNYLQRFPIDTLKIDQEFVQNIDHDANAAAITKAIIAMAQSLQLKVIAEGVETDNQLTFLRQSGCHAIQGYLFSPPVPANDFEKLLIENKRL